MRQFLEHTAPRNDLAPRHDREMSSHGARKRSIDGGKKYAVAAQRIERRRDCGIPLPAWLDLPVARRLQKDKHDIGMAALLQQRHATFPEFSAQAFRDVDRAIAQGSYVVDAFHGRRPPRRAARSKQREQRALDSSVFRLIEGATSQQDHGRSRSNISEAIRCCGRFHSERGRRRGQRENRIQQEPSVGFRRRRTAQHLPARLSRLRCKNAKGIARRASGPARNRERGGKHGDRNRYQPRRPGGGVREKREQHNESEKEDLARGPARKIGKTVINESGPRRAHVQPGKQNPRHNPDDCRPSPKRDLFRRLVVGIFAQFNST